MPLFQQIATITSRHLRSLNVDLTAAFPDTEAEPNQADAAYIMATGFALAVLLDGFDSREARAAALSIINRLIEHLGYGLLPVGRDVS